MGTSRTTAEALLWVIPQLINSPERLEALLNPLRENGRDWVAIQDAMEAGKVAIQNLPEERAKKLTVGECCVYMRRSEDHGGDLLRQHFRGSGKFKLGRDYQQLIPETPKGPGKKSSPPGGNRGRYWVHWRKPLAAWWGDYEAHDQRGKHPRRINLTPLEKRDALLQKLLADLAVLGHEDLAMARRKECPWLTDAQGWVIDNLWLSAHTGKTITQRLVKRTARVEFLTLETVMTQRGWTGESNRAPWLSLWRTLIAQERNRLDELEGLTALRGADVREGRMAQKLSAGAGGAGRARS
jgi:hypothetical protein